MSIGDEEIYYNKLGAVILFQCRTNALRLKWRQGLLAGRWIAHCVEETVAHFVTECVVLEGGQWVREQFGVTREEALGRYCSSERRQKRRWRGASRCWICGGGEEEKWIDKCRDMHVSSAGT